MFQFHKGTIRTLIFLKIFVVIICFNSIKVQLERLRACLADSKSRFQFHKGTIRTVRPSGMDDYTTTVSIP